ISETEAPWFDTVIEPSLSDLRIGWAKVAKVKKDYQVQTVFVSPEHKPKDDPASEESRVTPKFSLFDEIRSRMAKDVPHTVLFIHGFNYTFPEALTGAAKLRAVLKQGDFSPFNIIVFTWPSDGEMIPWVSYASDRRDAHASGSAGGRALLQLWDFLK